MLNENILSIESLILCLSGMQPIDETLDPPSLHKSDIGLIQSFSTQIIRKIGFTDRQYALAKKKVDDYSSYFSFINDLESIKNRNELPFRQIDRSRYIKIVENDKNDYQIAVRFTFQKKLISALESLRSKIKAEYDKQSKIHYFPYSEKTLYEIVNIFADKNFEIDETILNIYEKIKLFKKEDSVPGVYNLELKNISNIAKEMLENEIGKLSAETALLYKDRSLKYAIKEFNYNLDKNSYNKLTYNIANRSGPFICTSQLTHNISDVLLAFDNLKRFPLLCIVPSESAYDSIVEFNQFARNLIPSNETSVAFRMDNQGEGIEFNNFIRTNKLNNKFDINTKLLYTIENKIPKPLLQQNWKPNSIFVLDEAKGAHRIKKVLECFPHTDLVLFYKENGSPNFSRYFIKPPMEQI